MQEAALMTGIPRSEEISFDQIVRGRETQVLRTAYRILGNWADAEDVAQEAFVRLHHHGLRFEAEAQLGSWLYRVTVNLCFDRLRVARPAVPLPDIQSTRPSAETEILARERKERLMAALDQLPPRERAVIVLREIEGLSTSEVASILGSTEGTVRSQVFKAFERLRGILTREEK
jgi:RNA polymerase sigma-70 factor, ECF subfamily